MMLVHQREKIRELEPLKVKISLILQITLINSPLSYTFSVF